MTTQQACLIPPVHSMPMAALSRRHYSAKSCKRTNAKGGPDAPLLLDMATWLAFAIDLQDSFTCCHSQSVSHLAVQIARRYGLNALQVEVIRMGGILHDIGKIGVPEQILKKPGVLTLLENEQMKIHPVLGEKILQPLKSTAFEGIRAIVRHHHEMVDGKGYPDGLCGHNIPLGARIIAVADCYNSMVSGRAYKPQCSREEALNELRRCSGSQFDPEVVDAFSKLRGFPPLLRSGCSTGPEAPLCLSPELRRLCGSWPPSVGVAALPGD